MWQEVKPYEDGSHERTRYLRNDVWHKLRKMTGRYRKAHSHRRMISQARSRSFTLFGFSRLVTEGHDARKQTAMLMKNIRLQGALLLAIGMLAFPARAQQTAKKTIPTNPGTGASEAVNRQWNEIGRKLVNMAEDFPASPSTKTFGERLIHAAAANYYFTNLALGQKPPAEDAEPPSTQFKNKAALVAYVRKSFTDGAAAIEGKGDKGILDLVVDPFGFDDPQHAGETKIRLCDLAGNLIEHSGEVYGQLSVYYRVAGMIPPEARPKKVAEEVKPTLSKSEPITSRPSSRTGTMPPWAWT